MMHKYFPSFIIALALHLSILGLFFIGSSEQEIAKKQPIKLPEIINATVLDETVVTAKAQQLREQQATQKRVQKQKSDRVAWELKREKQRVKQEKQRLAQAKKQRIKAENQAQQQDKKRKQQARNDAAAEQKKLVAIKKEIALEKQRQVNLKKKQAADEKKRLAKRKKRLADEKKQADAKKRKAEAERVAAKKRKADADKKEKARLKAVKQRQVAAESLRVANEKKRVAAVKAAAAKKAKDDALQAENARVAKKAAVNAAALIDRKVTQNWNRPSSVTKRLSCKVRVSLVPSGDVMSVSVVKSSGDPLFDNSVERAIYKASPLPVPKNPEVFEQFRRFTFIFSK